MTKMELKFLMKLLGESKENQHRIVDIEKTFKLIIGVMENEKQSNQKS